MAVCALYRYKECGRGRMPASTAAILRDSNDDAPPVPEESKAIFYAAAELAVRYHLLEMETLTDPRSIAIPGRASPARLTPSIDEVSPQTRD
jgi:hypothetical protein